MEARVDWTTGIRDFKPYDEREETDQRIMLECIDRFPDVLTRANEVAHMTASGFVLNRERTKALMVYHNIYDSWSWTGGHADGETDLLGTAIREVREETGVESVKLVGEGIFSLDVLPVLAHEKKGKHVAAHLHLSVAYLLEADEKEPLRVKADENSGVKWIPLEQVVESSSEPHMQVIYSRFLERIEKLER